MTPTRPAERRPHGWGRTVIVPCVVLAGLLAVAGGLATGGSGVLGAVVGAGVTVVSLLAGQAVLRAVKDALPVLVMVVALMTYAVQVILLLALYAAFARNPSWDGSVSTAWIGIGALVTTVVCSALIIRLAKHERRPLYELSDVSS